MLFPRSLLALATLLSFYSSVDAAVPQNRPNVVPHAALRPHKKLERNSFLAKLPNLLGKRQDPTELICLPDASWNVLYDAKTGDKQKFCNMLLEMPPATTQADITPTITSTVTGGTTAIATLTERTTTTTTFTETETITPAAIAPRAVNAVAIDAQARQIFMSVLVSGTAESSTSVQIRGRDEAIRGLSTACSCLNVDPTSTVTMTFSAPAVHTTISALRFVREVSTLTKSYTETSFVSRTSNQDRSPSGGASVTSVLPANSAVVGTITTGNVLPLPSASGSAGRVVVGLPFSCPGDNGKRISNIFNDKRYEYEVLCDTTASDAIFTVQTSNAAECAAECSFADDAFGYGECGSATFTAASGSNSGACLISGQTSSFLSSPGSITVVLTGVFTAGDGSGACTTENLTGPPASRSIDTSALIASITSAKLSLSTPGFVTSSGNGGVFRTRFSTGVTGTDGIYRYSWYELYASSSSWFAVYATSWSCTNVIPRTIVKQQPATAIGEATATITEITTILNGRTTTIISGTSTYIFTAGSGEVPPTAVPASTTSGGATFSTGFSTATASSVGGGGGDTPSASPASSAALSTVTGTNNTSMIPSATGTQGSAVLTVSGATITVSSVGGEGSILPPPAVSATSGLNSFTLSGETSTFNSTQGAGSVVPSPAPSTTVGSFAVTLSGSTATANGTGSAGLQSPSVTSGGASFTFGSSSATANSTGGAGEERPTGSATVTASDGGASLIVSGATATYNSTGGFGAVTPSPSISSVATSTLLGTGNQVFTSAGNTSVFFSTGGGGEIQPITITTNILVTETLYPTLSPSATSIQFVGTISGGLVTANGTGGGGIVVQSPTTIVLSTGTPVEGASNFTTSGGTALTSITGGTGAILPTPSTNSSLALSGTSAGASGAANFSTSGGTAVTFSTGGGGEIRPTDLTSSIAPSLTPSASANASTTDSLSETGGDRSGRFSRSRSSNSTAPGPEATSAGITASENVTSALSTESLPTPSSNVTLSPGTGVTSIPAQTTVIPVVVNTTVLPLGTGSVTIPGISANITVVSGTGSDIIPTPSANVTISSPAGNVTIPISLATAPSAAPTTLDFTNSGADRSGRFSRSSTRLASASANSTALLATAVSNSSSFASATVTASSNSSSEACTPTVSIETILVTHTLPATSCATTGNLTFLTPTATGVASPPQPVDLTTASSSSSSSSSVPSLTVSLPRRLLSTVATQDQINAACASKDNVVFNSDLKLDDSGGVDGWTNKPEDSYISFSTFASNDPHISNGANSGRVSSAAPRRAITISQPVTLCPGKQYQLTSWNRQVDDAAQCTIAYSIGNTEVYTVSPQEIWLRRSEVYTAGSSPQDVSVDLNVHVICAGLNGATVGTDDDGYMVAEFDTVSLEQV